MSPAPLRHPPVMLPVSSFIAEAHGRAPEIPKIACVSLTETAAEKLVSLTRRTAMEMAGLSRDPDPTLVRHIQSRGREFEAGIRLDYLEALNGLYEDWIGRYPYPKMIVETDGLDFVNEDEDRFEVVSRIESRLFGLFPIGA